MRSIFGRRITVACAILLLASAVRAPAMAESRDRVITYFDEGEWRIFDPARRTDDLFLKIDLPQAVYWDTSERHVEYLAAGWLFRVEWEREAQPWPELAMPWVSDWWFNPDRLCWQAASVTGLSRQAVNGGAPYTHCRSDLWQSDREGMNWRITRSDTADCGGCYFCDRWRIADSSAIRRRRAISLSALQASMSMDRWVGTISPIAEPEGEPPSQEWNYLPLRTAPGRGLALRVARYQRGFTAVRGQLYLIDRRQGKQRRLETPEWGPPDQQMEAFMEEHDGFLLLTGHRTYVYDLSTGDQILPRAGASVRGAAWIKRPAPARVDTAGLRRLRERFH